MLTLSLLLGLLQVYRIFKILETKEVLPNEHGSFSFLKDTCVWVGHTLFKTTGTHTRHRRQGREQVTLALEVPEAKLRALRARC